jgi:hypothetical protein
MIFRPSGSSVARTFGVSHSTISRLRNGQVTTLRAALDALAQR